jgi:AcrR family transcriptional regulator
VERRARILRAALELFARTGDRGFSLQELADQVGLTQQGLMHYFGSREELLLAVLRERDRLDVEVSRDIRRPGEGLAQAVRQNMDEPGLVRLFTSLSAAATDPGHHAHGHFADRYRELAGLIAEKLAEQQREGTIRADAPAEHMARLLLAAADGLQIQWLLDPSLDMASMIETLDSMCRALPAADA